VFIAFGVMTIAAVLGLYYPKIIRNHGVPHDWIAPLEPEIQKNLVFQFVTATNTNENLRLQNQVETVANRAEHHFRVMNYYLTTYFSHLLLGSVFGGLAAISLLLVTRRGWDNSGGCLISFFLSTTVCSTFFFGFSNVCQMDETAKANKLLYLRYASLLHDARTFAATGEYARDNRTNTLSARDFMFYLDETVKKVGDIAVSFDPARVPMFDFSEGSKK